MLMKQFRKKYTGPGGYKCPCCDFDGRAHKAVRRSARRQEKAQWKKEVAF